jgi:NAD-dependent dihydropyrimidine dehydrogenase PreA subunit
VESVIGSLRVKVFITWDQPESLFSLVIDHFRAFLFSCSFEHRVLTLIRAHCLSVQREDGSETSIHFLVNCWLYFNFWKVLECFYVFPRLQSRVCTTVKKAFCCLSVCPQHCFQYHHWSSALFSRISAKLCRSANKHGKGLLPILAKVRNKRQCATSV